MPVTYLLGRDSVGRAAGLIGAGIMALAPFAVFYGVEARPYAAVMFFVALSTLALVRATRPGAPARWWVLYALAAAAAAYSHYTAIFVLDRPGRGAWSLWACRRRIMPIVAYGAVVELRPAGGVHVRGKALAVIGGLEPLTAANVLADLPRAAFGYPYARLK